MWQLWAQCIWAPAHTPGGCAPKGSGQGPPICAVLGSKEGTLETVGLSGAPLATSFNHPPSLLGSTLPVQLGPGWSEGGWKLATVGFGGIGGLGRCGDLSLHG